MPEPFRRDNLLVPGLEGVTFGDVRSQLRDIEPITPQERRLYAIAIGVVALYMGQDRTAQSEVAKLNAEAAAEINGPDCNL